MIPIKNTSGKPHVSKSIFGALMAIGIGSHIVLSLVTGFIQSWYTVKMHKPVKKIFTLLKKLRTKSLVLFFLSYAVLLFITACKSIFSSVKGK